MHLNGQEELKGGKGALLLPWGCFSLMVPGTRLIKSLFFLSINADSCPAPSLCWPVSAPEKIDMRRCVFFAINFLIYGRLPVDNIFIIRAPISCNHPVGALFLRIWIRIMQSRLSYCLPSIELIFTAIIYAPLSTSLPRYKLIERICQ